MLASLTEASAAEDIESGYRPVRCHSHNHLPFNFRSEKFKVENPDRSDGSVKILDSDGINERKGGWVPS